MYLLFRTVPETNNVDLEHCVTASAKQGSNGRPPRPSVSKPGRRCVIAVQTLDGRAILIHAMVKEEVDGDLVLSSAKKQISQAVARTWHQRLVQKLLMGLVVGTARVKQVPPTTFSG